MTAEAAAAAAGAAADGSEAPADDELARSGLAEAAVGLERAASAAAPEEAVKGELHDASTGATPGAPAALEPVGAGPGAAPGEPSGARDSAAPVEVGAAPAVEADLSAGATTAEPMAEADFTTDNPRSPASSASSGDDFAGPPLSAYWVSMLNVSKTADPKPPPKPAKAKAAATSSQASWGWAKRDKGGKGMKGDRDRMHPMAQMNSPYMMPMGPYMVPMGKAGPKGWKGGKGGWKGMKGGSVRSANDIGAFVAWAKDPTTEDGSRRERSRSPRRTHDSECLENFLTWARDDDAKEELADEGATWGDGMNDFMAWATDGADPDELAEQGPGAPPDPAEHREEDTLGGTAAEGLRASKAEPEDEDGADFGAGAEPPEPGSGEQLIVPEEFKEQLRAMKEAEGGERNDDSDRSDADM